MRANDLIAMSTGPRPVSRGRRPGRVWPPLISILASKQCKPRLGTSARPHDARRPGPSSGISILFKFKGPNPLPLVTPRPRGADWADSNGRPNAKVDHYRALARRFRLHFLSSRPLAPPPPNDFRLAGSGAKRPRGRPLAAQSGGRGPEGDLAPRSGRPDRTEAKRQVQSLCLRSAGRKLTIWGALLLVLPSLLLLLLFRRPAPVGVVVAGGAVARVGRVQLSSRAAFGVRSPMSQCDGGLGRGD